MKKCNECWLTGCVNGPPCCDTFPLERKLIKRFYWKVSILRSGKVFINSYLIRMYAESSVRVIEIEVGIRDESDSSTSGHVARTAYCAHIRRVTKKGEAPQYVINGKSNLSYNDNCELHECLGNTTVRRRVLSKSKRQNSKTQKARMSRTPLELTPTSESVKYTPREHGEMQQVMRRPFEKHSQRSIV